MISIEQVRALLSLEQLERYLQQKPQGAPAGIVAGEQVKDSRGHEWGYSNVIALYLADQLGIERAYVDYSCVWMEGEAHPFDFGLATWEWVETLLILLDDAIAGNDPMCRVITREQVLALLPFVRAKISVSAQVK